MRKFPMLSLSGKIFIICSRRKHPLNPISAANQNKISCIYLWAEPRFTIPLCVMITALIIVIERFKIGTAGALLCTNSGIFVWLNHNRDPLLSWSIWPYHLFVLAIDPFHFDIHFLVFVQDQWPPVSKRPCFVETRFRLWGHRGCNPHVNVHLCAPIPVQRYRRDPDHLFSSDNSHHGAFFLAGWADKSLHILRHFSGNNRSRVYGNDWWNWLIRLQRRRVTRIPVDPGKCSLRKRINNLCPEIYDRFWYDRYCIYPDAFCDACHHPTRHLLREIGSQPGNVNRFYRFSVCSFCDGIGLFPRVPYPEAVWRHCISHGWLPPTNHHQYRGDAVTRRAGHASDGFWNGPDPDWCGHHQPFGI